MKEEGRLHKIGGSRMVAIPPYMLKFLGAEKDEKLEIELIGKKIIINKSKGEK